MVCCVMLSVRIIIIIVFRMLAVLCEGRNNGREAPVIIVLFFLLLSTPWGDVKSPFVLSAFGNKVVQVSTDIGVILVACFSGSRAATPAPKSPVIPVLREEEFEGDDEMEATSKPVKQAQTDKLLRFSDSLDFSSPNNDSTISAKVH